MDQRRVERLVAARADERVPRGMEQGAEQDRGDDGPAERRGHGRRPGRAGGGAGQEMRQRRRRQVGLLGQVVPLAQHDRVARRRLGDEGACLASVEHAALQGEAALRIVGQARVVAVVGLAEIALGVDVQLDRVEHRVGEQAAQERQGEVLVRVVDAAQGRRLALVIEEMAEVVQQAGGDELVAGVALLGEVRRLQRVLELRHRLAAVLLGAVAREQLLDVSEAQHGACRPRGRCVGSRRCRRARRTATGGSGSP